MTPVPIQPTRVVWADPLTTTLRARRGLDQALAGVEPALERPSKILAGDARRVARAPRLDVDDLHLGAAVAMAARVRLRLVEGSEPSSYPQGSHRCADPNRARTGR